MGVGLGQAGRARRGPYLRTRREEKKKEKQPTVRPIHGQRVKSNKWRIKGEKAGSVSPWWKIPCGPVHQGIRARGPQKYQ